MDHPPAGDKGEPSPAKQFPHRLVIVLFALFTAFSCTTKKKEVITVKPVVPDSTVIRQQIKTDSLAKATSLKKKIYITFDDGPNAGTLNVLQAVKAEKVPVTFFIVAKHVYDSEQQGATWDSLQAADSIELCNHSYSHASNRYKKFYQQPAKVVADFERSEDSLQFNNKIARMPGRNAWRIDSIIHTDVKESREAIDSLRFAGFDIMGWDVEWAFDHTTFAPDADTALLFRRMQNLLNDKATKTPGHLVLLAHDQAFRTVEDIILLKKVLASLKNNPDYELLLASQYPGVIK